MSSLPRCLLATAALFIAACGEQVSPPPRPAVQVDTITVQPAKQATGRAWDGVVQAVDQATLSAQTSGRVLEVNADIDQPVAANALLVRLTADEQQAAVRNARAALAAAEAQLVDALARHRRAEELAARQLASRDDLDRLRATREAAQAARDAAAAVLEQVNQQLAYTEIHAPYAGVIAARHVEPGEAVAPGQPLLSLYVPGKLRLEVQLPQGEAAAIRAQRRAAVELQDGRVVEATGVIVYPHADPAVHSTTVRVLLPVLPRAPRPGETARVRFATGTGTGSSGFWLPAAAVVLRGELAACYVVQPEGLALRQLRIGRRDGDRIEVIAGLAAGEQVATDPSAALQGLRSQRSAARDAHE